MSNTVNFTVCGVAAWVSVARHMTVANHMDLPVDFIAVDCEPGSHSNIGSGSCRRGAYFENLWCVGIQLTWQGKRH